MPVPFLDLLGFLGVLLLVVAYFLLQNGRISGQQLLFPSLNFAGSSLILLSLCGAWNGPAAAIEIVWMAISLYGIVRILRASHRSKKNH